MRSQGASNGAARRSAKRPRARKMSLAPEERELLQRACRHYRSSVPSYLASRQAEVEMLERLLRRLD